MADPDDDRIEDGWPARFPYGFEQFLFYRWVTACHLRQRVPPALTVTEAR